MDMDRDHHGDHQTTTRLESPSRRRKISRLPHPPRTGRRLFETQPQEGVAVALDNSDLWSRFHRSGTEMIITKTGRRMFPSLQISLTGLHPEVEYSVLLEVVPGSADGGHHRLRFSGREWVVAGRGEAQAPAGARTYVHPDSPAKGAHWMSASISFSKVKLTNNSLGGRGHVVLTSMHRYLPRVHVVEASPPLGAGPAPKHHLFSFPETEFVAVTAYQNGEITKLKIDHNPFAKGFREGGMSRSKRKMEEGEADGFCRLVGERSPRALQSPTSTTTHVPQQEDVDLNNNDGHDQSGTQEKVTNHRPSASQVTWAPGPFGNPSPMPPPYYSPMTVAPDARTVPNWPLTYDHLQSLVLWASLAQQAGLVPPSVFTPVVGTNPPTATDARWDNAPSEPPAVLLDLSVKRP
ncbi:T-box protein VegT-like [Ischnura elegans]|uniref:T-box protein VegT-like n=1 Tax=Ischnura elegans TaxID=197161 RepID=UPI001ED8BCC8|nr:T-box protein VegT-like [Ischnura elegans]